MVRDVDGTTPLRYDKMLRGLKPSMSKIFWPDYDFDESGGSVSGSSRANGGGGLREGINRGKLIHKQIQDFINCDYDMFKTLHPEPCKGTRLFVEWMTRNRLRAICSEFEIYDEQANVGTAIDVIAQTQRNSAVLIELKTGHAGYFQRSNGPMRGPLSNWNNCPLHQAYVQLLLERAILKHRYNFVPAMSYVVQINEEGVFTHELPAEMVKEQDAAFAYFVKSMENFHHIQRARKHRYVPKNGRGKGKKRNR